MGVGNTQGAMYALKKMQKSNGGNGGRIITTASVAGVQVCLTVPDPTTTYYKSNLPFSEPWVL